MLSDKSKVRRCDFWLAGCQPNIYDSTNFCFVFQLKKEREDEEEKKRAEAEAKSAIRNKVDQAPKIYKSGIGKYINPSLV